MKDDLSALTVRRAVAADAAAVRDLTRSAYAKWIPLIGREVTPATQDYDWIVRKDPVDLLIAEVVDLRQIVGLEDGRHRVSIVAGRGPRLCSCRAGRVGHAGGVIECRAHGPK